MTIKPTERLYYEDPFVLAFSAHIAGHGAWSGVPSVLLDRSAFYPESGGQLGDRGTLDGQTIRDVQVDEQGLVHHLLEGALPAVGSLVNGTVERARRRVHMALHTGQHILSRALADEAGAETVSSRLGENTCTIDVDRDPVDEAAVARAEALTNSIIDDSVHVRAYFPAQDELASLPLRRAPKVSGDIRVVVIGDFDVTPCGGTHCTNTAQVGLVRVLGIERYKGKSRIHFSAGKRARDVLWNQAELVQSLSRELTCGPEGIRAALEKLRRESLDARESLGRVRARLAQAMASALIAEAQAHPRKIAVSVVEDANPELLRTLSAQVTAHPELSAALAGQSPDGLLVLLARGSSAAIDCGALLKQMAKMGNGRGGGRPERAEGRFPADTDWNALVHQALNA